MLVDNVDSNVTASVATLLFTKLDTIETILVYSNVSSHVITIANTDMISNVDGIVYT